MSPTTTLIVLSCVALPLVCILTACMAESGNQTPSSRDGVETDPDSTKPTRIRLSDFETRETIEPWKMVNDDVMGGRSIGDATFGDSVMVFAGSINTNGGGFSSVRMDIKSGTLADARRILLRVKPDGRPYRIIIEDEWPNRPRNIVHRRDIEFGPAGEWQVVSVDFDELTPTFHGEPVEAQPLNPERAVRAGIMLNDVEDGPFRLEVDWVDAAE